MSFTSKMLVTLVLSRYKELTRELDICLAQAALALPYCKLPRVLLISLFIFPENSHLRSCQETRRTARDHHPHASTHQAQQTRSLLHPIQDSGG